MINPNPQYRLDSADPDDDFDREAFIKQVFNSKPSPTRAPVPDDPTQDEVNEILMMLDEMAMLGDSNNIIVRRSNQMPPPDGIERLLLSIFGYAEEEWTFLVPSDRARAL